MSTVINNPVPEKTVVQSDSSGWAIAVIILIAIIAVGGFWYFRYYRSAPQPEQQSGATINLTLPAGSTNSSAGTQTQ